MKGVKKIFIVSSLLILITCSKDDGYGPTDSYSGSSNSYNPPSSDYGSSSTSTTSVTQYSLTVSAGTGGSVSTSGGTYNDGSSVSITATPNDGYEFTGWNGSNSTNSTISVTINSNTVIEALFTEIPPQASTETTSTETASTETTSTETTSTETTSSTYNLTVTAQSSSNYSLSGSDQNGNISGNDPSVSIKVGDTFNFNLNVPGHPFFIIINSNGGFESNNLPSGITNNGASTGTVSWTPTEAGTYYYICEYHPSMIGTITVTQ